MLNNLHKQQEQNHDVGQTNQDAPVLGLLVCSATHNYHGPPTGNLKFETRLVRSNWGNASHGGDCDYLSGHVGRPPLLEREPRQWQATDEKVLAEVEQNVDNTSPMLLHCLSQ